MRRLMRRLPNLGSLAEWLAAALVAAVAVWLLALVAGPWLGGPTGASPVAANRAPSGVPSGAQSVSLLVLLDGTEIRVGDAHVDLHGRLGALPDDAPAARSDGPFGDRFTYAYDRQGTRFFLVCEPVEPGGPVRVARIYLPR